MKRKFSIFLNIVLFVVCVGSLAYGVFSAQRATVSVTGTLGFTAHNCLVAVSAICMGTPQVRQLMNLFPKRIKYT